MNLEKRKQEIELRLNEIRKSIGNETDVLKLTELETEVDSLQEERGTIEKKMSIAGKVEFQPTQIEKNSKQIVDLEKRGTDLRESRTIQVSADEILLPQHVSSSINPQPFSEVSTIVDKVKIVNLQGGETYKKSFVKGYGNGGLTTEGGSPTDTEPEFGYATITKVKVTAYTEITEELEKLPALPYQAEVIKNINISIKKKIAEQILNGAGTSNTFTGIFCKTAVAIETAKDKEISTIDDSTLDDIIFAYGGDEEVEGGALIILNKNDLRAFAKLRTAEGRKVHSIDYVNKTIDGIAYIISSQCKALSDSSTSNGQYTIAYGALQNYEVPVFSNIEISKSTDYKFKDGITCYKASVFTGGNVVSYNGFLRIKKKVTSTPEEITE